MTTGSWCTLCHRFSETTYSKRNIQCCTVYPIRWQYTDRYSTSTFLLTLTLVFICLWYRLDFFDRYYLQFSKKHGAIGHDFGQLQYLNTVATLCAISTSLRLTASCPNLGDLWNWNIQVRPNLSDNANFAHETIKPTNIGCVTLYRSALTAQWDNSLDGGSAKRPPPSNQLYRWQPASALLHAKYGRSFWSLYIKKPFCAPRLRRLNTLKTRHTQIIFQFTQI